MYKEYKDRAQFLIIYIKEAHPSDDWANRVNQRLKYIKDPTTLFERFQVANSCLSDLKVSIPCLVDDMKNTAARAYKGWPDRLFVVGKDGRIAYTGKPGPHGFLPHEMERALGKELAVSRSSEKARPGRVERF